MDGLQLLRDREALTPQTPRKVLLKGLQTEHAHNPRRVLLKKLQRGVCPKPPFKGIQTEDA